MPRDLETEKATLASMAPLTKEPAGGAPPAYEEDMPLEGDPSELTRRRNHLHPYVQTLTMVDLESCASLENEAFPPHEAASREKFVYRLQVCGELSLGLFTSLTPSAPALLRRASTASTGSVAESGSDRTSVLLAHIISTKSNNATVTDNDMALPENWKDKPHAHPELGHQEEGRTICLHSLAVLPEYQKAGLGSTLLKSYLQRVQSAEIADRIALLAHQELIPFYEKVGFVNKGKSKATYGGGGWNDMVYDFKGSPGFQGATFIV